jgi:hypothetical protein
MPIRAVALWFDETHEVDHDTAFKAILAVANPPIGIAAYIIWNIDMGASGPLRF